MAIRCVVLCLAFVLSLGVSAVSQELAPLQEPDPAEEAIRNEDMSPDAVAQRYAGVYSLGPGHYVSILDGREATGGLVFYDHASGLMRHLTHSSGRIYTYGPSFDVPEPNIGSVTFLARNETARILWLPETPPAQMGRKLPAAAADEDAEQSPAFPTPPASGTPQEQ